MVGRIVSIVQNKVIFGIVSNILGNDEMVIPFTLAEAFVRVSVRTWRGDEFVTGN